MPSNSRDHDAAGIVEHKACEYRAIEKTSPSGKTLFQCLACERVSVFPDRLRCGSCPRCTHPWGSVGHHVVCHTELVSANCRKCAEERPSGRA